MSVFLILFVDLVLAAAACTPLPNIISCPIALNACVSTVENCFFKFSTIGLAFAAVFFNPVCIAPESITCFNSAEASDAAFWSSSESTSCSNCALPFSCCSFKSSTISFVKNLGDFWLLFELSPPSFLEIKSLFGFILLVYPVKGSNGDLYSSSLA